MFVPHYEFVLLARCAIIEELFKASVSSSVNGVCATYSALPTHGVGGRIQKGGATDGQALAHSRCLVTFSGPSMLRSSLVAPQRAQAGMPELCWGSEELECQSGLPQQPFRERAASL